MSSQDLATSRAKSLDWNAILKDLIGTAIVSMLLMVPMVAYKSIITQYSLILKARWGAVFIILGVISLLKYIHVF